MKSTKGMKNVISMAAYFILLSLTGCAVKNTVRVEPMTLLGTRAEDAKKSGLALAGGGTKAASYSMGILATLASDEKNALQEMTAISSVSGGGYAALFLYSKLMLGVNDPSLKPADYFKDCIPSAYQRLLPAKAAHLPDQPLCDTQTRQRDEFRFQQFVRCRQDVLESDCRPSFSNQDSDYVFHTGALFALTLGASVPNFVARTVFDWPVNLSPSRALYRAGIGSTYGLFPLTSAATDERANIVEICDGTNFKNCDASDTSARMQIKDMTFPALRKFLEQTDKRYPVWIVNATASKKRSFLGWAMAGQRDFSKYTLQMSPYAARSGLYGALDLEREGIDLLDGVTAAASFFDANQTATGQPARMALAGTQHLLATDWGTDVPNRNVGNGWRVLHALTPFPLYYLDGTMRYLSGKHDNDTRSAYIRLLDGGNNDGFGAYSLIETRMNKIFIADNLGDDEGRLADLCYLRNEIELRYPYGPGKPSRLLIPGLEGFDVYCQAFMEESEGQPPSSSKEIKPAYPITAWRHKVLLGCIRSDGFDDCAEHEGTNINARIYFMKPTLDMEEMTKKYIDIPQRMVQPDACASTEPGLCELSAYVLEWYLQYGTAKPTHPFPQDSTALMTLDSDPRRYGAYRELGRWHMSKALKDSRLSDADFAAKVADQKRCPVQRVGSIRAQDCNDFPSK